MTDTTERKDALQNSKKRPRQSFMRRAARLAIFSGAAIFIAAHIYALALGFLPAPQTWNMTGRIIAGETLQHQNINIDDVSPFLIAAVIAAEDARFCTHHGIDSKAIEKAIEDNKKGRPRRGGSTITQQTAKNLFFWNGGGMARKAGEAYAALFIDAAWPKPTIMQHYLNIAEWGDGIFGAEAAAQARFGKTAKELSAYESALLASVLPSPNKWRLDPPSAFVKDHARTINARLKVIARQGFGDCVLLSHPAYEPSRFGAAPVSQAKTVPKSQENENMSALHDILRAAETAAKDARETSDPAENQRRAPSLSENQLAPDEKQSAAAPD